MMQATQSETAPALRYLDPAQVRAFRTEDGRVRVTIEGERSVIAPRFLRAFPLNDPERYISIREQEPNGKEIGLLRNWQRMDREQRDIVQAELDRRYLYAIIQGIVTVQNLFGVVICELQTDRGMRQVTFRDMRDNVIYLGESRVLLTDAEGNRYDIPDLGALDRRSRALLSSML